MANKNLPIPPMTQDEIRAFWTRVQVGSPDECWEWQRGRTGDGYGAFIVYPQLVVLAHRIAYFLRTGIDPAGQVVRHYVCDNPPCCNPDHLRAGTNADNSQDMVRKGRAALGDKNAMRKYPEKRLAGEKNGNSTLTTNDAMRILQMSADGISGRAIHRQTGFALVTIQRVINRQTWRHLTSPSSERP